MSSRHREQEKRKELREARATHERRMRRLETVASLPRRTFYGAFWAVGMYSLALIGCEYLAYYTPKDENRDASQLELMLAHERSAQGIPEDVRIQVSFSEQGPYAGKKDEKQYMIALNPGWNAERTLRHEVYHIADGHLDNPPAEPLFKALKHHFWQEPQAAIYSVTGSWPRPRGVEGKLFK